MLDNYDLETREGRREYAADTVFGAIAPCVDETGRIDEDLARPSVAARMKTLLSSSPKPIIELEDVVPVYNEALKLAQEAANIQRGIMPADQLRGLSPEDFLSA